MFKSENEIRKYEELSFDDKVKFIEENTSSKYEFYENEELKKINDQVELKNIFNLIYRDIDFVEKITKEYAINELKRELWEKWYYNRLEDQDKIIDLRIKISRSWFSFLELLDKAWIKRVATKVETELLYWNTDQRRNQMKEKYLKMCNGERPYSNTKEYYMIHEDCRKYKINFQEFMNELFWERILEQDVVFWTVTNEYIEEYFKRHFDYSINYNNLSMFEKFLFRTYKEQTNWNDILDVVFWDRNVRNVKKLWYKVFEKWTFTKEDIKNELFKRFEKKPNYNIIKKYLVWTYCDIHWLDYRELLNEMFTK